jgi:hypothetical protein
MTEGSPQLRLGHGEGSGLDNARIMETRRKLAAMTCYACGARGDEKHDQDAHREYARAALG